MLKYKNNYIMASTAVIISLYIKSVSCTIYIYVKKTTILDHYFFSFQHWDTETGYCIHQFTSPRNTQYVAMTALPSPQPVVAVATSDLHLRSATLLYPHIPSSNLIITQNIFFYFSPLPPFLSLSLSLSYPSLLSRFIDLRMKSYQQLWRLQYPTAGKVTCTSSTI